jgi:hypothetical protein
MTRGHRIGAQIFSLAHSRAGDADAIEELNFVPRCVNWFTLAPPSTGSNCGQQRTKLCPDSLNGSRMTW